MTYRASRKRRPKAEDLTTERDLQTTLMQAANLFGYLTYHTYDSRRSPEGFPDLVIAGHSKLLMWELKAADGRLTAAQQAWLERLASVEEPPQVEVIRPQDLDRCLEELQHRV